jgi:hypothetical protein
MKPTLYLILVSLAVWGLGCATPYKSSGFMGGFSETRLAEDVFRVNFRGNGYTSPERTQDFAMLRAAELAQENGFKYFAIIDESASTDVSTFTTSGSAQTTGSASIYGRSGSYYGNYSERTTYTPPQTHFVFKPRSGLLMRCFAEKPDGIYVLEAAFLRESIKAKYKIDRHL